MRTISPTSRRLRAILDGLLILLLALLLTARDSRAQAQVRDQAPASHAAGFQSVPLPARIPAESASADHSPAEGTPELDNNTLAAVIAAENAALTPPQYLLDLPLVHH
jgi:hypothetical protein